MSADEAVAAGRGWLEFSGRTCLVCLGVASCRVERLRVGPDPSTDTVIDVCSRCAWLVVRCPGARIGR